MAPKAAAKRKQDSTATAGSKRKAATVAGATPKKARSSSASAAPKPAAAARRRAAAQKQPPKLYFIRCSRTTEVERFGEGAFEGSSDGDDEYGYDGDDEDYKREAIEARITRGATESAGAWLVGEGPDHTGRPFAYSSRRAAAAAARDEFVELMSQYPFEARIVDGEAVDGFDDSEDYKGAADDHVEDLGGGLLRWWREEQYMYENYDGGSYDEDSDTTVTSTVAVEILELDVAG